MGTIGLAGSSLYIDGLALGILAVLAWARRRRADGPCAPWGWLVGGAALQAGAVGVEFTNLLRGPGSPVTRVALALLAGAILLQAEFVRRGRARAGRHARFWLVGLLPLAAAAIGLSADVAARLAAAAAPGSAPGPVMLWLQGVAGQSLRAACAVAAAGVLWFAGDRGADAADESARARRWFSPALLAVLAAGSCWVANWNARQVDTRMRESNLAQVLSIARTIDARDLAALTFTSADSDAPQFQRLRRQLIAYADALRLRSIWSVTRRGDDLLFGPENLAVHDPFASPPGTRYLQPPPQLREVFVDRRARSLGPYTDEYGSFVSVWAPVIDPRSADVPLVIGIDVEARAWQAAIARAHVAGLASGSLLIALLIGAVAITQWRDRRVTRIDHWLAHVETVLTVALGLGVTSVAVKVARDDERHEREAVFERLADNQARSVLNAFQTLRDHELTAIVRFFMSSREVTRQEYHAFAQPRAGTSYVQAWTWAPAVPRAQRAAFESAARREGLVRFAFYERGPGGSRVPAADRDVLYPVYLVEPPAGNEHALGFDLGSEPVRRAALEEAAATGLITATDPITLVLDSAAKPAILVYEPVYAADSAGPEPGQAAPTPPALRGFAAVALRLETMLRQSLDESGRDLASVDVSLYMLRAKEAPVLLCATVDDARLAPRPALFAGQVGQDRPCSIAPLFVLGQSYALVMQSGPAAWTGQSSRLGRVVGATGLLLTLALATFVGSLKHRHARLEARVRSRTAELQASQERLRRLIGAARDAIIMIDDQERITQWNDAAVQIFGYTLQEAMGRSLHRLIAPEHFQSVCAAGIAKFQATGEGAAIGAVTELMAVRKGGEEFPIEVSLAPVNLNGKWHAVGIARDVTQRNQAQAALHETNRRLQEAMAVARELAANAERANAAKSEFLANMSHEIRTPLNGVIGMLGLLLDGDLSSGQRADAELARDSAHRLLTLINDILDFSKIEAHKLAIECEDFDPRALLEETAELLAIKAHEKGVELLVLPDADVPERLRGDAARLRQVLVNLAGNAVKFTAAGEVALRLAVASENGPRVILRCEVRDTGIGLPKERRDDLFSPFVQGDGSMTREYGGTGLGLAICKQLVELMGGEIGVESEAGAGSCFWFFVPLTRVDGGRAAEPDALAGSRLLVVGRNAAARRQLVLPLRAWGCRADESSDGEAARAAREEAARAADPYRAILIDVPAAAGRESSRGAAAEPPPPRDGTPCLRVMPHGRRGRPDPDAAPAPELHKPFRRERLREALAAALGLAAPPARARRRAASASPARTRSARILLVEDDPTNQIVARRVLAQLGFQAQVAADGVEALATLRAGHCDLVLMDCQMPRMDGFEATRRIRRGEAGAHHVATPIVAMTAHALSGDREHCLAAGMDGYVVKPVDIQALSEAIERHLAETAPACEDAAAGRESAEPPADGSSARFDRRAFLDRLMGDEDLAGAVVGAFLEDMPTQVEALRDCVRRGDLPGATLKAHRIKGAASTIGALALSDAAREMEATARAADQRRLEALSPQLAARFTELQQELQSFATRVR